MQAIYGMFLSDLSYENGFKRFVEFHSWGQIVAGLLLCLGLLVCSRGNTQNGQHGRPTWNRPRTTSSPKGQHRQALLRPGRRSHHIRHLHLTLDQGVPLQPSPPLARQSRVSPSTLCTVLSSRAAFCAGCFYGITGSPGTVTLSTKSSNLQRTASPSTTGSPSAHLGS